MFLYRCDSSLLLCSRPHIQASKCWMLCLWNPASTVLQGPQTISTHSGPSISFPPALPHPATIPETLINSFLGPRIKFRLQPFPQNSLEWVFSYLSKLITPWHSFHLTPHPLPLSLHSFWITWPSPNRLFPYGFYHTRLYYESTFYYCLLHDYKVPAPGLYLAPQGDMKFVLET